MSRNQLKFKNFRYWQYQYELVAEYGLTHQQGVVYAYLYNHCVNINENGYCGYSDERMANEIKIPYSSFKKELKILKEKKLITVENPGKRTKKTGESRMIYINAEIYIQSEKESSQEDIHIQKLQQEIEALKQRNTELEQKISNTYSPQVSFLGVKLVKSGFMTGDEYIKECEFYNTILQKFLEDTDFEWVQKSFSYFANKKDECIKCFPSYLTSCIKSSVAHYNYITQN